MDYRTARPDSYGLLKAYARENRRNPTPAERVLWDCLRDTTIGVKFLRQHVVGDFIVDFVSREGGLVIEVDGGYHSEPHQELDDLLREKDLEQMGFHILRFSNEEVLYDIDNVLEQIKMNLK